MHQIKDFAGIHALRADYHPVLGQMMKELDLAGTINRVIGKTDTQANIDTGTFVALMIHHVLGDVNIKMYKMDDFFQDKAIPLLIPWDPTVSRTEINDDRAARVLDALWDANPQFVFSAVASSAISKHGLSTDLVHWDTTSKSFNGAYDDEPDDPDAPRVTRGHSKDYRPDLKQLIFGAGTTMDGIPIVAEVASGNESDMTLNGRWVPIMRSILNKEPDEFLLYVADSSLVTTDNLRIRKESKLDILSRLPGRFTLEKQLKQDAIDADDWEFVGKLSEEKKAASYKVWNTTGKIEDVTYRFIVVHSDHKDKRKSKKITKAVKNEHDAYTKQLEKLAKRRFACREDAQIESLKYLTGTKPTYHSIVWNVQENIELVKRPHRGRPRKGEARPTKTSHYLIGSLTENEDAVRDAADDGGLFVLITTLMDKEKYPAKLLLERYKGQGNIERIFRFLKNPAWVGAMCLKKPERLAALGYVLLMAAIIYTLWERRVRRALASLDQKPIEGLNRQKTKKPTSYALQVVLGAILVLYRIQDGELLVWLSKPLKLNQKRVIELSGFSPDIYEGRWNLLKKTKSGL
jgi:transposase